MAAAAVAPAGQSLDAKRRLVRIGTHSGTFHCDEALGCFLLQRTPLFQHAEIVRSRDAEVLKDCDVVLDVGGTYDPDHQRFDHHQRGFDGTFGHGFTTKLSSAGLVYKHHGRQIIADVMGLPVDHADVETVWLAVYKHFMEAIDAIDNGINQWDAPGPPRYVVSTHLSARVGQLNPRWNEDSSEAELARRFAAAVALTGAEFMAAVDYYAKAWLPARAYVRQALEEREAVDAGGRIIRLPEGGLPWKEHLYDLEAELGLPEAVLFCLYSDDRAGQWRVQAVSEGPGSFQNRRSLPAAWRGLRDDQLSQVSGIPGCVFVHASGFIGGNMTEAGATEMARQALVLE